MTKKLSEQEKWYRDMAAEKLLDTWHQHSLAGAFTTKMRRELQIRPGDPLHPVADSLDEIGSTMIIAVENAVKVAVKRHFVNALEAQAEIMEKQQERYFRQNIALNAAIAIFFVLALALSKI